MTPPPILPVGPADGAAGLAPMPSLAGPVSGSGAFADLLLHGVDHVQQKVADAERLASAFALDDSIPLHQVTFALQEARLSLEFLLQVRTRLVEAYQQFATMQL